MENEIPEPGLYDIRFNEETKRWELIADGKPVVYGSFVKQIDTMDSAFRKMVTIILPGFSKSIDKLGPNKVADALIQDYQSWRNNAVRLDYENRALARKIRMLETNE